MKPPPTPGLINRVIALTLLLLTFTGTLGLGAVWLRQGISSTANANRALEDRITEIERRLDGINAEVAEAVNPEALLGQNNAMRLALATPRETHVVRVSISPEERLASKRNQEIFRLGSTSADSSNSAVAFRVALR